LKTSYVIKQKQYVTAGYSHTNAYDSLQYQSTEIASAANKDISKDLETISQNSHTNSI
jgi:hypothetical protein